MAVHWNSKKKQTNDSVFSLAKKERQKHAYHQEQKAKRLEEAAARRKELIDQIKAKRLISVALYSDDDSLLVSMMRRPNNKIARNEVGKIVHYTLN